jgi:hypothetical protein
LTFVLTDEAVKFFETLLIHNVICLIRIYFAIEIFKGVISKPIQVEIASKE